MSGARALAVVASASALAGAFVACGGDDSTSSMSSSTTSTATVEGAGETTEVQSPTAFLGTQVQDDEDGALVVGIAPDSPAAEAGIEKGDLIVAVDGEPVRSGDDLLQAVGVHAPGDEVTITVERDGKRVEVRATLVENPGASGG
jgi:S1-C subfamily serine protease